MARRQYRVFTLAWRNIWRNTRRTLITTAAVVFAVFLAIFSWCFALGEHEQMIRDTLKIHTGHIQVHKSGYWDDRTIFNGFTPSDELLTFVDADERVEAWVRRLNVDALISTAVDQGGNSGGIMLIGVEPERERSFTSLPDKVYRGEYLTDGDASGIFIGEILAKNLEVEVNDSVIIMTQDIYGALSAGEYTVVGIFKSNTTEMDRGMAFITLDAMRYLLSIDEQVSEVSILLSDSRKVKKTTRDLKDAVDLERVEVMTWQELMPDLVQFIEFDNAFGYLFFVVILLVVIFGILNTILMAVMERYREFGVMMALGTRPNEIIRLIMMESALIAFLGIIIGDMVGFGVAYYFTIHPWDFSQYSDVMWSFGIDPKIYARMYPWVFYVTDMIILGSTLLAAVYPAVKASRLRPVQALRYI
ncbi:MAG: ABC transporter permease [Deltaproteobacteria bacterium]|nr:ABC transporter permease [Candidatus Zymogenaceae bacterium]